MRALRILIATLPLFLLSACVANRPYPESWSPLPLPPTEDCRHFEGSYGDRGEMPGFAGQPSLTQQLFGTSSGWKRATRVSFSLQRDDVLEVTVWEGMSLLFTRTLTSQAGQFTCEAGRLVVRDRRGVSGPGVAGLESVTITLSATDDYLVAQVKDFGVGLAMILPVAGTTTSWYRFPRARE
jgi:hypothetical protein